MKRTLITLGILLFLTITEFSGVVVAQGQHRIDINLPEYRLYHYIGDQLVGTYSISIGNINTPTPVSSATRRFEIYTKVVDPWWKSPTTGVVVPPGPTNPLGTRWLGLMTIDKVTLNGTETWESLAKKYGTSVSSILNQNGLKAGAAITSGMQIEIPHSDGYGIHGTIVPTSIGTSVSLGCMRVRNPDIERLFEALPSGVRIPVTINYMPIAKRVDALTNEIYYELFYDVYKRIKDWPGSVQAAADSIGATINPWLNAELSQRFSGSRLLTNNAGIYNNGQLLAIGAIKHGEQFFVPSSIVEEILGLRHVFFYDNHYLGAFILEPEHVISINDFFYMDAEVVRELTGKGYYYEPMLNSLEFSITRLMVDGALVGYNRVFLHPTRGPLVPLDDLAHALGLNVSRTDSGKALVDGVMVETESLGDYNYLPLSSLEQLGLRVSWNSRSGEVAVVLAQVVSNQ